MLEEYEKSLIANEAYLERIMQILDNIKLSKLIRTIDGKSILQISDGEETLNIYSKGNCFCINLDGTNFNSIIGCCDSYYLYKNEKLGIDYKLNELVLGDNATKRTIQAKLKNYNRNTSYIDDMGELLLIYSSQEIGDEPNYTVYDKNLINLNNNELSQFIVAKREKQNEDENEVKDETNSEEKPKLPRNVEDFDYSSFEEEENLDQIGENQTGENQIGDIYGEDIDELEQIEAIQDGDDIDEEGFYEMIAREQIEDLERYYKNFVALIDEEKTDGLEKMQILQGLDAVLTQEDDDFFCITESIDRIFATYEAEIAKLTPQREASDIEK